MAVTITVEVRVGDLLYARQVIGSRGNLDMPFMQFPIIDTENLRAITGITVITEGFDLDAADFAAGRGDGQPSCV